MRRLLNDKGITLIELVTAVVLVGLIAALAVPRYLDYMPKLRAKTAAKEVVSAIRGARALAVAEKRPIGVYFNSNDCLCVVFRDTDTPEIEEFSDSDDILDTLDVSKELVFEGESFNNQCVLFDLDGSSNQSGQVYLRMDDSRMSFNIDILASTGRVKLTTVENN